MPSIVFVDSVTPNILDRLRANVPPGFDFLVAGPGLDDRRRAVRDADVVMTWTAPVGPELVIAAERARIIQKVGQGVDNIDLAGARARGVPVCNAGATNTTSVAEHTILLMLAACRRVTSVHSDVRDGLWPRWEYRELSREISGKRVGIVGLGNIGRKVAQRLRGWECELAYNDIVEIPADVQERLGVRPMALDELLGWCDILTLHVYLDERSRHLIGQRELALLRRGTILVNASRGPVVDEAALIDALQANHLLGAGLDVLEQEPPDPRNPLLRLENVVLTSHIAGGTWDALEQTIRWAMRNSARAVAGERPDCIQNGV